MLLQFIVRELAGARLLIVGTYRDMELNRRHPLSEALGDLSRERLFDRVLLRGLSHDDVGRFIEVTSGISPPTGLVDAVHTQTEGNPLFVTEVVILLVQEGELSSDLLWRISLTLLNPPMLLPDLAALRARFCLLKNFLRCWRRSYGPLIYMSSIESMTRR
jgi:predicted ATPase